MRSYRMECVEADIMQYLDVPDVNSDEKNQGNTPVSTNIYRSISIGIKILIVSFGSICASESSGFSTEYANSILNFPKSVSKMVPVDTHEIFVNFLLKLVVANQCAKI